MIFKTIRQSLEDVYIAGRKINELNNLKLNATNITAYATALKGLNAKQAELVLSTQGLTLAQKQAILSQAELLGSTGKLTTAELNAILVTKKRNKDQAEALLINTGLITSETAEATATNVVTAAKLKELVATGKLTQAEANLIAAKAGVTLANQKESASFLVGIGTKIKGAGTALKGLGTGILTIAQAHPVIAGITAALALCGGAALVNKVKQEKAAKAIKEAYEEAKNAINEINNTFSENSSKTKEIAKEYAELAQGVNLLTNENKNLSTEKYERFLELSNQLSTLYPSLTKNFDENGVAILDLSGDVDTIVGSLDDLIERQRVLANQEIMKQMPDLFAGYSNNIADLEEQKEDAKKTRDEIQRAYEVLNSWDGSTVWWSNGGQVAKGADNAIRSLSDYTNALDVLGIKYKKVAVDLDNDPYHNNDGFSIEADYKQYGSELSDIYVSAFNKASDDVKYAEQQFEAETSSINQYLNTWLQTEFSYNQIEDSGLQKAIQDTLFNFDWSSLPEGIDKNDWEAVSEYLRRNILFSINNINDSDVSEALANIYSGSLNSGELLEAIAKVQEYFGSEHPISINLQAKVDDTQPLINNVKEKLQDDFDDKVGELTLEELHIAAEQVEVPEGTLLTWDELIAKIKEVQDSTSNIENPIFSSFTNTDFGTRIQHITDMFNEGTISHKEYFDALQSEIDNFDASNFTDSMEDMTKASAQFFVDSMQQAADGLSGLINSFDNGEMSISEYLEGYLAIGNTLSTLTDNLQENSAAWNEHGEAISEVGNTALDDTQNKLNSAMSIIESYQDSIYSLEQIMNDAVTVGSDEFTAHANVIAEDLYYIIQTGGEMADTIANTLGTTTSEIAQSLTENVSNQEIACQAIMANTNNAITSMADSIGQLFDTLGNAISNFKVDLSFGVKTIDWKKVNVLGTELSLPEIKFELGASGESLDKIGSALSSFGKTIASNYTPQTIELEDFHFGSTDAAKDRKYSPSSGITNNYENALDRIKDATKSTSSSAKSEFEEMVDFFERRIDELEDALSLLKTSLDNVSGSFAKNNLIDAELGITEEKFNNYTDALATYTQKANEALSKLPADIAAKVKDGAVALTDFIGDGNKDVVEAIKEYESWADKVSDCKQELEELKTTIRQLELEKFNNIMDDFSNQFDLRGDSKNLISKQIDLLKEAGELIGESFYTAQINQSKKQLELLENEKAQLVNQMNSAIGSGRVNCCPLLQ